MVFDEKNMFVFVWKIENYSYSWQDVNEYFSSPSFQMCSTEGSSWKLRLYPRGISSFENSISLYLERESEVQGPMYLSVDYDLSFLKSDGTPGYAAAERGRILGKGETSGFANLVIRDEIMQSKKSVYLPDDTLTVRCRIGFEIIGVAKQVEVFARSTVWVHRQLLLWDGGVFSYVSPCRPGYFAKLSLPKGELLLSLNEDCVNLHLAITDVVNRVYRFKIGILDSSKSTSNFLIDEFFYSREKNSLKSFLVSRSKLLQNKNLYLPENRLILHCEWIWSRGIQIGQVECHVYDGIFTIHKQLDKREDSKETPPIFHSLCCSNNNNSMKNDFQNLLAERTLCDFTIKVGSESLPVHKAVLSARSSVFKAMLTSKMRESEKNQVDISDLELDTVRRMLTFMYSDTVDNLDWERANKLYFAADKYDIPMLKFICSEFLKINMIAANVEDVLTLANTHSDEDLKNVALKFLQCITKEQGIVSQTKY